MILALHTVDVVLWAIVIALLQAHFVVVRDDGLLLLSRLSLVYACSWSRASPFPTGVPAVGRFDAFLASFGEKGCFAKLTAPASFFALPRGTWQNFERHVGNHLWNSTLRLLGGKMTSA